MAYALYGTWLKITHPSPPAPMIPAADQVKRLVAVQLERLGDLVLIEPALRALRLHYPKAQRVLIAPPGAGDLYAGTGWGEILAPQALEILRKTEEEPFDLAIDLTGRVEYRIAKTLAYSGISHRIGYNRAGRGIYHTIPLPWPEISLPMRRVYLALAQALGSTMSDSIPRLPRGDDRLQRGRDLWRDHRLNAPVVLLPGAHQSQQRWALGNFAAVGRALRKQGVEVAVVCGPDEEGFAGALAQEIEVPLVSGPTMSELMDLLATSQVAVCNNTGPMHLAAALGVPTISTMGPTIPWRWWPVSDAPTIVFRSGSQGPIADMRLIDPLEVAAAVLHLLDE
ncbi:MAG: glycosyltransferase family 9 protein [bacterium]